MAYPNSTVHQPSFPPKSAVVDHHDPQEVPVELRAQLERFAKELLPQKSESSQQPGLSPGELARDASPPGSWEELASPREPEEALSKSNSSSGPPPCVRTFTVTPELLKELPKERLRLTTLGEEAGRRAQAEEGKGRGAGARLEYVFAPETSLCAARGVVWHGMVQCCAQAWSQHLPLLLRPEHFWTMVLQGIAAHVDRHPEELRERFVAHQGKMTIRIRRDGFIKGSPGNDWGGCVREFAEEVEKSVKPRAARTFRAGFSTAGPSEELVAKVTVMDMVKHYFEFRCVTRCGFPTVSLLGSLQDWRDLRARTEEAVTELCLEEFAKPWLAAMLPILDRMLQAYEGKEEEEGRDPTFWNAMIKRGGIMESGGFTGYTGWLHVFLPLLRQGPNPYCVPFEPSAEWVQAGLRHVGAKVLPEDLIPKGESAAPMIWEYYDVQFPMEFRGGFLGYTQDPASGAVCPVLGWYLVDKTPHVKLDLACLAADRETALRLLRQEVAAAAKAA